MAMRVAIFTDNDLDRVNGVTTTLGAVLTHAPSDVLPRIYTAATIGVDAPDYLALRSFPVPNPFHSEMALYLPRFREYLRRVAADDIDVLHLTTPGPMGLAAVWIAARTGLPLVGSLHADPGQCTSLLRGAATPGGLKALYMRWMYGRCMRTLAPSHETRERLLAAGLKTERVEVWTRGVDTEHFCPERRCDRLRDQWRVGHRDLVVLYVGRVVRERGLGTLPEMLYRLRALGVPHRMVIAGDGPFRKHLEQEIPDAIFTGTLNRADVASVYASADVLVVPSAVDTGGSAVLEAQASGLPVVVGASGGATEQMWPDVTGIVCDGADPHRWADALARLMRDGNVRAARSYAAREYALGRRWTHALAPLYQTYRDALRTAPYSAAVRHAV